MQLTARPKGWGTGRFPRSQVWKERSEGPNCQLRSVTIYWMTTQRKIKYRACEEGSLYCLKFPPGV